MKYITVKLTEDQARHIISSLEFAHYPEDLYNETERNMFGDEQIKLWKKEDKRYNAFNLRVINKLKSELVK